MKNKSSLIIPAVRMVIGLAALLTAQVLHAAGPFTVNTTTDSHATSPATSPNDGTGHVSLRSAIEAANAQAGATTINVPAGNYNLTLGELDIALNGGETNTISGAGAATTIVTQTDTTNRVFNIDYNSLGSTIVAVSGITIQGGHDGLDNYGGAGILAGSIASTPKDILTLSNCVVQNNHCTTNTTREPGGGIQMAGGDLNLIGCTFNNNSSGQSFGGAVFTFSQTVISSLNAANCVFANNSVTNDSGAGPDGGGAIMIETVAGSIHNLTGCAFTNNRVYGIAGDTYGGAVQMNGGTLNLGASTFVANSATGVGGLGGAIYADSGTVNMSFCRLTGNSASTSGGALYNHSSNSATTTAVNNWWGCDGGPGASGCDVAAADGAGLTLNPWLTIVNTASPSTINAGQSTTLTASVLQNSASQALTAAQVSVLLGLPLTWSAGVHGGLSGVQTTIQTSGLATATFSNDGTCNDGSPGVTLDNGTATALVIVQCPDLTITKTNNVNGTLVLGGNWTWDVHVANDGLLPAVFATGETIALDNMPNSGVAYGAPSIANVSGVSGSLVPAVDGSDNLSITSSSTVTLSPGGSFDLRLTATPAVTGIFGNPRSGGVCMVDPNNDVNESNEGNNSATDSVAVTCPVVTGTVSGSTSVCPGGSAIVMVTLSGGIAPYSVTLNNGGGTQSGPGPLFFTVNPAATTTYQVSSGTDADSCPVSDSGSATVTVIPQANPVINLSPTTVLANSGGNEASAPAGLDGYAWTISNGIITGPTNQPTVTYVAGTSNNVVLGLTVLNPSDCSGSAVVAVPVISGFSTHTNVTFTDALAATTTGMTFDGTNYWSCSGGTTSGTRFASYGLTGAPVASYAPGLDFRSLMTRWDGTVLARQYNSSIIYQQSSPGVFTSWVTLTGGTLDLQSSVVLDGAGTEFDAMSGGVVSRWSTNGTYIGSNSLSGFGTIAGENISPQSRGLAAMGNFWLTYNGGGVLSIWTTNGTRITQLTLPGAGTSGDSDWSFSYCNGKVFIVDIAGGTWHAFDLFSGASVCVLAAEGSTSYTADVMNKISSVGSLPTVNLSVVTGATPTLAQLRSYQAVLVFTDDTYSDPKGMGNVLADYLDQGGGVVMQTFSLMTNVTFGISGRISTNGYMPFNGSTYAYPGSLTMVKDLPLHPLLDGVNTFNGGSSSFQNIFTSTNSGTTVVAHWSNGQAFEGSKDNGAGRFTGLNFFPPSSDATSGFWVSTTDGARLMANALLWSGKIPPTIISGPADQALAPGATANFKVTAAGTSPIGYQWRLNGTNLTSATNSTLSFIVQSGSGGAYSVVVSNLYGTTTSLNAQLNPQLRFLTPIISSDTFSLYLANVDGSPVATNRADRVSLYSTTNLHLAWPLWTLLTNPVVPSGSQLRADGFNTSNNAARFFRAVEAP